MRKLKVGWLGLFVALVLVCAAPVSAGTGGNGDLSYTVWIVVFNNPDGCSDGVCDEDDVFDDPVTPQSCFALFSGGRVQSNRRAAFGGSYEEGGTVGTLACFSDTGEVLEDSEIAEIHLVARTHSGYIQEIAHEQITDFFGGCGVQHCEDTQAAVFLPNAIGVQTSVVINFSDGSEAGWATLERRPDGVVASFHTRVP